VAEWAFYVKSDTETTAVSSAPHSLQQAQAELMTSSSANSKPQNGFVHNPRSLNFSVEACTDAGVTGTPRARGESVGTVTEHTGDPLYRVTNCTGSLRGGGMARSHTACSAASLQWPSLCSLHSALQCSIPSTYPSLSQM